VIDKSNHSSQQKYKQLSYFKNNGFMTKKDLTEALNNPDIFNVLENSPKL